MTETTPLYSEILPGLWQGGTHQLDEIGCRNQYQITKADFDSVFTLYGHANPVDWHVQEYRLGFYDGSMHDFDPMTDLYPLVTQAYLDWKAGKKVLIRCQAGWNRSGLVTALVLIMDGYQPQDAIDLIREKRCEYALSNRWFVRWLLEEAHPSFWINQAA